MLKTTDTFRVVILTDRQFHLPILGFIPSRYCVQTMPTASHYMGMDITITWGCRGILHGGVIGQYIPM